MKRVIVSGMLVGVAFLISSCATRNEASASATGGNDYTTTTVGWPAGETSTEAMAGWPMYFQDGTTRYTIFEPECDSWDGHQMTARSAVAVQPAGQAQPTYGLVGFNAITLVDKTAGTATLADFKLTSSDLPSTKAAGEDYLVPIVIQMAKHPAPVSLDRLESSLTMADAPKPEQLNNLPPKIIVAKQAAVLVSIDGPPALRPVANTSLQRVINTRMLLLKDQSGQYYLHLGSGYMKAASLDGPWSVASQAPDGADAAEKAAMDSGQVDLMSENASDGSTVSLSASTAPEVFVATRPSELITFKGEAQFTAIAGTDLLYAENTSGNFFKTATDQKYNILISGRWYSSGSLDGPWTFVPGNELPHDFANIPDTSPKENVKASVPGTPQAEEALIANSIPQGAEVARSTQMAAPQTDGAPQLEPIDGTSLHYVANSGTPILEVDPQSWYACQNGVWYQSGSVDGPWAVATSVPQAIYTIPPSSPMHYLTYVQVYGSTPDTVYEGYTPGYMGTEVADDGTVVYGTGYDYDPWIGSEWYGAPVTYGCGFGWGWGFGAYPFFPPHPWWGGFRGGHRHDHDGGRWAAGGWRNGGRHDLANTGANLYHRDGAFRPSVASESARVNRSVDVARAYNSRTGQIQAGLRAGTRSVYGSAWNPGPRAYSRLAFSPGFVTQSAPRSLWNYGGAQNRPYYAPRFGGAGGNWGTRAYGGWNGGGGFNAAPRSSGGWFHGGGGGSGGFFHGGGGGGGGFHGGGGGGHGGGGHGR